MPINCPFYMTCYKDVSRAAWRARGPQALAAPKPADPVRTPTPGKRPKRTYANETFAVRRKPLPRAPTPFSGT